MIYSSDTIMIWIYVIGLYVVLLIILIVIQYRIGRSEKNILRSFNWEVDSLWYKMTQLIYDNRDNIHDYDNSLDLLYANRKAILESDKLNYADHFDEIEHDVEYVGSVLGVEVVERDQLDSLKQTYTVLQQSYSLYKGLGWIVKVMTLGLYALREPRLEK